MEPAPRAFHVPDPDFQSGAASAAAAGLDGVLPRPIGNAVAALTDTHLIG
jgi:hypothetical protein